MKGDPALDSIKTNSKTAFNYVLAFVKWFVIALFLGIFGGILGSFFHISIDFVTDFRGEYPNIVLLLPLGSLVITVLYRLLSANKKITTDRVIESVRKDKNIPLVMMPLIFAGTVITHLVGGSSGREGAALQLGGSMGYNIGKFLRLEKNDMHIIVMTGMSAVFAALFGTPVTAAIFSLEVTTVGFFHYAGLLPCIISSVTAVEVAKYFGLAPVRFDGIQFGTLTWDITLKVMLFSIMCAVVSILFCAAQKKCSLVLEKLVKNVYLRAVAGGFAVLLLTVLVGNGDYNGAGMNVISRAIAGEADNFAFLLKIVFTAFTIAAGFKGGEIVPAFFIGSTFGCVMAPLLGMDPSFTAAIGFVALFCGVVNCPVASFILAVEVFGADGILFFAIACSVSYMMSGRFGIYHSQKIMYSKIEDEIIDKHTI